MVRETVADVAQATFFDVLLDGIERFFLADLHLGVGPTGDLDDHVEYPIVLVGEEGDIMEGREDGAVLLDEDSMFYNTGYTMIMRLTTRICSRAHRTCLVPRWDEVCVLTIMSCE
jgi:hypothetical protein